VSDSHPDPIVDGRPLSRGPLRRVRFALDRLRTRRPEAEEARVEAVLQRPPALTRTNTVAVVSPKGGVGKTTVAFLVGNVLAGHLRLRAIAVDAKPDFGRLAALRPPRARVERSLNDLLAARDRIATPAELRPYVGHLPSGLHVLAAPTDAGMRALTPAVYGELLAFLSQFYEVIVLDLGTGIVDPLTRVAVTRADQLLLVGTPAWAATVAMLEALDHLGHRRTTLVVNQHEPRRRGGDVAASVRELHPIVVLRDERLEGMLHSGSYSLGALDRPTRLAIKRLGATVADGLV
jgi:putative peptide zinc metalloprotease protein